MAETRYDIDSDGEFKIKLLYEDDEVKLTPKTSSSGAEGTMFYNSTDDHVYVATE